MINFERLKDENTYCSRCVVKILGIETVTRVGSLAVVDNRDIVTEVTVDTNLKHAAGIVSALDSLLASVDTDITAIDTVAVDVGPGSFTGIRVGIASAKGLVQPGGKRLLGVCSLEVLCYEVLNKGLVDNGTEYLTPFIDAKRGGIYTGWYKVGKDNVQVVKEPYLTTLKKLLDEIPSKCYIFGPDVGMIRQEKEAIFPSAGTVVYLAEKKINEKIEEKSVEPMYIYDVEYRKS